MRVDVKSLSKLEAAEALGDVKSLSKLEAAEALGYTQASWDNTSGNEEQPAAAKKQWSELTDTEKSAVIVLGYTEETWSTISETKKSWTTLTDNVVTTTGSGLSGEQNFCMLCFLLLFVVSLRACVFCDVPLPLSSYNCCDYLCLFVSIEIVIHM